MRTEQHLRDAVRAIADRAPGADEVKLTIPSDETRRPRRRLQLAVAVAATGAAVAVPVLVLTGDQSPEPAAGQAILRSTVEVRAEGWRESSRTMFAAHQWVGLTKGRDDYCAVIAFEPGAFDPGRIPAGSATLTVRGNPGYFAEIVGPLSPNPLDVLGAAPSPSTGPNAPRTQVVVWKYADNAWATSHCTRGPSLQPSRQDAESVANGTVFRAQPVRVPVKLGYLPDGLDLVTGELQQPQGRTGDLLRLDFLDHSHPAESNLTVEYTTGFKPDPDGAERLTLNGRPAFLLGPNLVIGDERSAVSITAHGAEDPRAELIRVAEHLELARDPQDRSTWFDGADALP